MKVREDIVYTHTYKVKANREGKKKKKGRQTTKEEKRRVICLSKKIKFYKGKDKIR